MKKLFFSLTAIMILFAGCDGFNIDIDDIPRTLRISVRQMTDVDGGFSGTELDSQVVSSTDGVASDVTVGTVTITSPLDTYMRSDVVTVTATEPDTELFAYWLLPSRTDSFRDPDSTEGNIKYGTVSIGSTVSLRTDNSTAEIIGVYALDGGAVMGALNWGYTLNGDNSVDFSFDLSPVGSETIKEPRFRIFDENNEATTEWEDFYRDNESVVIPAGGFTINYTYLGVQDPTGLANWNVVVIYQDPVNDDVYVVK